MPASDSPVVLTIPGWIDDTVSAFRGPLETDDDRMALALALAKQNVEQGGGPFGAVLFVGSSLAGAGVNLVLSSGLSIAHAEIVAMIRAQRGVCARPPAGERYSLVTTTEPCCQCFGAIVWSPVDHLVCGARTADAEAIGFDEGPKPASWVEDLEDRAIAVSRDVRRDEARAVFIEYVRRGGTIYGRAASTRRRT